MFVSLVTVVITPFQPEVKCKIHEGFFLGDKKMCITLTVPLSFFIKTKAILLICITIRTNFLRQKKPSSIR